MRQKSKFDMIHSNVIRTVLPFLLTADLAKVEAKCENCEKAGKVVGETPDCYSCLLPSSKARTDMDNVIDQNAMPDVFAYQNKITNIANRNNVERYKILSKILESAMYLRRL